MARRLRRRSVRLWQTELFIIVIVVAILILSVSLSQGLQRTLVDLGESDQLSDATRARLTARQRVPADRREPHRASSRTSTGTETSTATTSGSTTSTARSSSGSTRTAPPRRSSRRHACRAWPTRPPTRRWISAPTAMPSPAPRSMTRTAGVLAVVVTASSVTDSLAVLDAVRGRLVDDVLGGPNRRGAPRLRLRRVHRQTHAADVQGGRRDSRWRLRTATTDQPRARRDPGTRRVVQPHGSHPG